MSALPPIADIRRTRLRCPLSAKSRHRSSLFDHLVGAGEQRWRHGEAEHLGGLEVDDQLELDRLHDRQVSGLLTFEDAADIEPTLATRIRNAVA